MPDDGWWLNADLVGIFSFPSVCKALDGGSDWMGVPVTMAQVRVIRVSMHYGSVLMPVRVMITDRNSRPAFLESPASSFFVSSGVTGC